MTTRKKQRFNLSSSAFSVFLANKNIQSPSTLLSRLSLLRGGSNVHAEEDGSTTDPSSTTTAQPPSLLKKARHQANIVHHQQHDPSKPVLPVISLAAAAAAASKENTEGQHATSQLGVPTSAARAVASWVSALLVVLMPSQNYYSPATITGHYYLWTLAGTAVVWHLFFYLLSVGYALGIGLPVTVALLEGIVAAKKLDKPTTISPHAVLVVLWSIRLTAFLLYREYIAWPAWQIRMRHVEAQQRRRMGRQRYIITVGSWLVYAAFYGFMALPALRRVWLPLYDSVDKVTWLVPSRLALLLQMTGLALETVADAQKSAWKRKAPHTWCYTGVWRYSTHPNYLGEWLFWLGTYLSGLSWPRQLSALWIVSTLAMTVGFVFISTVLRGAVETLQAAQYTKYYRRDASYRDFVATTGVWGPRKWRYYHRKINVESNVTIDI